MATANTPKNIHGFEDGKWYKFRSVGDNNVIQLESQGGSKLICMPENSDLNEIQLFGATILPSGKFRVAAKCQKSQDACQVWDFLSHRELLMLKKQSSVDKSTQNWASEHVPGYHSVYLIQSSGSLLPDTQRCIKNMGEGKQIKLINKSSECLADTFTRWYLELQANVGTNTAPATAPAPMLPVSISLLLPESVPRAQVTVTAPIPMSTPSVPVPLPVATAQPIFQPFKDGVWYKFRSVGDNNVIQIAESTDGHKLTCMPENNDLSDLQKFRVTLLPSGKFSITTGAKSLPVPQMWDYQLQGELLVLNLTIQQEIDKFSQNWAPLNIPSHGSQCLIQPNPSPEAPESDSHKCIKNMGQGKPIQLVDQSKECAEDNFVRWTLEPQDTINVSSSTSSTIPSITSFPDVVVALQAKEASNVNLASNAEPMDTA